MAQTIRSEQTTPQKVAWTRNEKRLFGTTFVAWILVNMDVAFFAFTYPAIQESLGFGLGAVAIIYGTVFATAALGSFALGPLVDRLGRKPFFQLQRFRTELNQ